MTTLCPGCNKPLTTETAQLSGGWDTSPYGDEFSDVLHLCAACGAWSMVTHCERYVGPPETTVRGPLSAEEVQEQRERIRDKSSDIDTTFDFREDTPRNRNTGELRDPDTCSDTLRRHHRLLWSKPLPNGTVFELELRESSPPYYLRHNSEFGEFVLSSDTVVPSFWKQREISDVIESLADEVQAFNTLGYTIGGMMVWPANRVNKKMTINAARGCHPWIKDRFDLTVECIRRYYSDPKKRAREHNPLGETFARYDDFFRLFRDFRGFVNFFLLQDLVTEDYSAVNFHMPFEEFETLPFPGTDRSDSIDARIEEYRAYKQKASDFIEARNERILKSG
jgi:hypothetical protein